MNYEKKEIALISMKIKIKTSMAQVSSEIIQGMGRFFDRYLVGSKFWLNDTKKILIIAACLP